MTWFGPRLPERKSPARRRQPFVSRSTSEDAAKDENPRAPERNTASIKLTTPYGEATDEDFDELVVPGPEESDDIEQPSLETFTATNYFEIGNIEMLKNLEGTGAGEHGGDVFSAQVSCTYDVDGVETPVELPDDGKVALSRARGWKASIKGIPAGASCQVVETDDGGSQEVTMDPADGKVVVSSGQSVSVTITNQFGQLARTGTHGSNLLGAPSVSLLLAGGVVFWFSSRRRAAKNGGAAARME